MNLHPILSAALATLALVALAGSASAGDKTARHEDCRRYVPSAGMTITVDCVDSTGKPSQKTTATAPAAVPSQTSPAPQVKLKNDVSYHDNERGSPDVAPRHRDAKVCGDILERVQLARAYDDDIATLRTACGS